MQTDQALGKGWGLSAMPPNLQIESWGGCSLKQIKGPFLKKGEWVLGGLNAVSYEEGNLINPRIAAS